MTIGGSLRSRVRKPSRAVLCLALAVLIVGQTVAACGAGVQLNFNVAEAGCTNVDVCRQACRDGDPASCDVTKVLIAEAFIAQPTPARGSAVSLHREMAELCHQGIARACKADETLQPMAAQAGGDARAKTSTAHDAATAQAARVARIKQEARELLKALGRDERACSPHNVRDFCHSPGGSAAGSALSLADADDCGPGLSSQVAQRCSYDLDEAEKKLSFARSEVTRLAAEQEEDARRRREIDAAQHALTEANDKCSADPAPCEQTCTADAAAYECIGLANLIAIGDARVAKTGPNPGRARELGAKSCVAGNRTACSFVVVLDDSATKCTADSECKPYCATGFGTACVKLGRMFRDGEGVTADQAQAGSYFRQACGAKIPDDEGCKYVRASANLSALFAQCSANRAEIERWRIAGVQAGRSGDGAAAQRATDKLHEIEPKWSQTLSDLREAIALLTGDQGVRFQQLVLQVKSQCSCEATRSGACR